MDTQDNTDPVSKRPNSSQPKVLPNINKQQDCAGISHIVDTINRNMCAKPKGKPYLPFDGNVATILTTSNHPSVESLCDNSIISSSSASSSGSENWDISPSYARDIQSEFRHRISTSNINVNENGNESQEDKQMQQLFQNGIPSFQNVEEIQKPTKKRIEFLDALNNPAFPGQHTYADHGHGALRRRLKPSNIRFNLDTNEAHAQLSAFSKFDSEEFSIALYVELPKDPNMLLCHVQAELAVAGLKAYFCSVEEQAAIELRWVQDVQDHIAELLSSKQYTSKFTDIIFLQKYECAMVLSAKASALLRHPKSVFLHSISTVLRTNPRKLLILVKDGGWVPTIPDDTSEDTSKKSGFFW